MFEDCIGCSVGGTPTRESGLSEGPRGLEIAQAVSSAVRVVRVRSIRAELRHEACEECTSCIIGGTSSARQEHTSRVKARGVRRVHKLHQRPYKQCAPEAHGSSKGSRRAKSAQAATSVAQVVRASSISQVEQTRGVRPRSLYKEYGSYHSAFIAGREELPRWRTTFNTW